MVTEVLSYLPAKSVSRFHAVSRSWRAALSSAPFIELHRRRANKPGELKLLFVREKKLYNRPVYFYTWQPRGAVRKLTPYKFHFPLLITKHLHGLVLVYTVEGYHVCNPSTGASLALPDSQLPAKMIRRPTWRTPLPCYNAVAYGLGYCSATKLYKVVRVFSSDDEHGGKIGPNCCEVLVLGALLYWRPSARQPPACFVKDWGSGSVVFVNGRLHFLSRDGGIIAFHVSRETFCSVEPPPNSSRALIKMTELDGCLCVFHGNFDYGDPYEVWLLTNYKQRRWKKLCRFDPNTWTESEWQQLVSSWIAPLATYTGENKQKKIMLVTGTCKVFAVDIPNGSTPEILFSFEEAERKPNIPRPQGRPRSRRPPRRAAGAPPPPPPPPPPSPAAAAGESRRAKPRRCWRRRISLPPRVSRARRGGSPPSREEARRQPPGPAQLRPLGAVWAAAGAAVASPDGRVPWPAAALVGSGLVGPDLGLAGPGRFRSSSGWPGVSGCVPDAPPLLSLAGCFRAGSGPGGPRPNPGRSGLSESGSPSSLRATSWSRWGDVLASYLGRGSLGWLSTAATPAAAVCSPSDQLVVLVQVCSRAGDGGLRGAANLGSWTPREGFGRTLRQPARVSCG
ncbi:hypothetical protein QYE76_030761 [Lolium multiflorum]|uniref:F-box associated beta-propeller type 3 domain-containing protein n=1 Tax=Lolium multiflorum TaxID=4521 RepID=A0AAD8QQB4_LOLMU|nr:hypothetical protein QYE76_030761 [Lolium multiflorum]